MQHGTKSFELVTTDGKIVIITSSEYSFELKELLQKRFGDKLKKFMECGKLEHELNLQEVMDDMPVLLENLPNNIDYKKHNFDTFYEVYFFFITYERNVNLRQIESEAQKLALIMKEITEASLSNTALISALRFRENTQPG